MQTWTALGTMLALAVLRLGLPLLVTAALVWWFRRLDARWQAEARAVYLAEHWGQKGVAEAVVSRQSSQPPCWQVRNCTDEQRAACAAYGRPNVPCWVMRLRREGKLPHACLTCELFAVVQSSFGQRKGDTVLRTG